MSGRIVLLYHDTAEDAKGLKDALQKKNSELVELKSNLVDSVWGDKRPPRPQNPVFPLKEKYSGLKLPLNHLSLQV